MKLVGLGRLGRDIELRTLPSGEFVGTLAIAWNAGKKGENGKRPSQWIKATLWGDLAQALAPHLHKGKQVSLVLGDVHTETFSKQDGTQGFGLVARVNDIELASSGQQPATQQANQPAQPQQAPRAPAPRPAPQRPPAGGSGFDDMSDDIPF